MTNADVALGYARLGMAVFPVADDKQPRVKWADLSTSDESVVRRWWSTWPDALVGVDCGKSGLVVVDLDVKGGHDGPGNWLTHIRGRTMPSTFAYMTRSGGFHVWFRDPAGKYRNSASKIAPGVDVRGVGGYVVAWGEPPASLETVADMPDGVLDPPAGDEHAASERSRLEEFMRASSAYDWTRAPEDVPDGEQQDDLFRAACSLRARGGVTDDEALEALYARVDGYAVYRADDPWEHRHADDIWKRICDNYEDGPAHTVEGFVMVADDPFVGADQGLDDGLLAPTLAKWALNGWYRWCESLGWLVWNGAVWRRCSEAQVHERARRYFHACWIHALDRLRVATEDQRAAKQATADAWRKSMSKARITAVTALARGIVGIGTEADELDAHPDLLNTPGGVVDMRTGEIRPHDPALLMTKITSGSYRPGFTHADWQAALEALPDDETRAWFQARLGQAATGHRSPDGVNVILQGGGENGKGALVTDGAIPALGDYAETASTKLIAGSPNDHSEEKASLRGKRLLVAEELTEGRALDVGTIKRISDVATITARHVHQRNMTFKTTHTLLATTNYLPVVNEVDHGTWRRLALLRFPFTFRKPHEPLLRDVDRRGDPDLKRRIEHNVSGQHDAIVTWLVDGAIRWHRDGAEALAPSAWVTDQTDEWRMQADRVLAWWRIQLQPDSEACVAADDMLNAFNIWLSQNGHQTWAKETFTPRFADHAETTKHGVERRRIRHLDGLVRPRPPVPLNPLSERPWAWLGVRFAENENQAVVEPDTPDDQAKQGFRSEWTKVNQTFSKSPTRKKVVNSLVHSDHKPESSPPLDRVDQAISGPPIELSEVAQLPAIFDLETADQRHLHTYGPDFVRLLGYLGADGIQLTTDADGLVRWLDVAPLVTGHNILGFDLLALVRYHGLDLHTLVDRGVVYDTLLAARHLDPPPAREHRKYDLDTLGERFGLGGKHGDLKKLAKEFGGYDKIPLDEPRYREYLTRDVALSGQVYGQLRVADAYLMREHKVAAIGAQISLNGFAVDTELLAERLAEGEARKAGCLAKLESDYGIPLTDAKGRRMKSPLATKAGKEALEAAFTRLGVLPAELPRTAKTGVLTTSGEAMTDLAARHQSEQITELCALVGTVTGERTIYQTISTHTHDGRIYPSISMEQSTGRWSTTNPGLTVVGKRGGRHREREVFLPDPGEVIVTVDLAQVDARAVAALSGDPAYTRLFEPGVDAHAEVARRVWGDPSRREDAKPLGHGWNYGMGLEKLAREAGVDILVAQQFDMAMRNQFPQLVAWQDYVRGIASSGQLLDNGFGRRMRPDPDRAHTQGPAFMGQGCARDLMMEGLLRLPREIYPHLRAVVHDEVVLSVPADIADDVERTVIDALSFEWRGVPIIAEQQTVTVDGRKVPARGANWGAVYAK